jgi:thioredoxin-related protein
MQPIVNGIKKEFKACLHLERVNFHAETQWNILLSPMGTPEFALLDSSGNIIYRWVGFTEKEEFVAVMKPLCG